MAVECEKVLDSFYNRSQFRRFVDEIDIPPQVCVFKRSQNLWGKLVDTLKCSLPRTQLWTSVGITLANGREQRFNPKTLYTCIPGTSFWHRNKNNNNKMTKTKKKKFKLTRTWLGPLLDSWYNSLAYSLSFFAGLLKEKFLTFSKS